MVNEVSDLCQDPTGPVWRDTQNHGLLRDRGGTFEARSLFHLHACCDIQTASCFLANAPHFCLGLQWEALICPILPYFRCRDVSDSMAHLKCNLIAKAERL